MSEKGETKYRPVGDGETLVAGDEWRRVKVLPSMITRPGVLPPVPTPWRPILRDWPEAGKAPRDFPWETDSLEFRRAVSEDAGAVTGAQYRTLAPGETIASGDEVMSDADPGQTWTPVSGALSLLAGKTPAGVAKEWSGGYTFRRPIAGGMPTDAPVVATDTWVVHGNDPDDYRSLGPLEPIEPGDQYRIISYMPDGPTPTAWKVAPYHWTGRKPTDDGDWVDGNGSHGISREFRRSLLSARQTYDGESWSDPAVSREGVGGESGEPPPRPHLVVSREPDGEGGLSVLIGMTTQPGPCIEGMMTGDRREPAAGVVTHETGAVRGSDLVGERWDCIPWEGVRRIAMACAEGIAKGYPPHNWRKGFKTSDLLCHAMKHLAELASGSGKEDDLGHALFNLAVVAEMELHHPELCDLYTREKSE